MCFLAHQTFTYGAKWSHRQSTVLQAWNTRAHSELLPKGTGRGEVQVETWPGAEGHRWSHCCRSRVGQVLPPLQASHHLRQSWRAAKTSGKNIYRHPGHCEGLAAVVDLEQQLKFPNHIVTTTLRPDVVLLSESTKQVVLLELTVPWEDRLEEAFERKLAKYEGLVSELSDKLDGEQGVSQSRSGSRGFAGPIPVQSLQSVRHRWSEEEKSFL